MLGGGLVFASLKQRRMLERTATDWFFMSAIAAYTYGVLISVNPRFSLEAATPFFVFALAYAIVRLAPITPQRWVDAAVLSGITLGGLVVFDFILVV
ncbi:MAG TPA: hypothetical protein ENG94_05060, partial [Actinobacteria bacterium]|nr:hypothetical protein [Actinomycetota bacterium]